MGLVTGVMLDDIKEDIDRELNHQEGPIIRPETLCDLIIEDYIYDIVPSVGRSAEQIVQEVWPKRIKILKGWARRVKENLKK